MSTLSKFAAVLVILIIGALAVGAQYNDVTNTYQVTNESITVDYQNATPVANADIAVSFNSTVTVYNASDVELVNNTDFTWHPTNGSVTWHDTANTVDGEQATISYNYTTQSSESRALAGVMSTVMRIGAYLTLVFVSVVLLGWLDLIPGTGRGGL